MLSLGSFLLFFLHYTSGASRARIWRSTATSQPSTHTVAQSVSTTRSSSLDPCDTSRGCEQPTPTVEVRDSFSAMDNAKKFAILVAKHCDHVKDSGNA